MMHSGAKRLIAIIALGLFACRICTAQAPASVRAPANLLSRVGFDQELGAQVPMQTILRRSNDTSTTLRTLLHGKPTILVPGYFGCPNLCEAVRAGVAHAITRTGFTAGNQFNVVLVSIDPREDATSAAATQHQDAKAFPHANVDQWHYVTGSKTAIGAVASAIGFRYLFDPRNDQFDHPAGIVLLTSSGKISQYLFGVAFAPKALRLALVEASHGEIGNVVDRLLLLCCNYDATTGRYTIAIHRVMQGLGIGFAMLAGAWLILLLRRDEKKS